VKRIRGKEEKGYGEGSAGGKLGCDVDVEVQKGKGRRISKCVRVSACLNPNRNINN